MNAHTDTNAPCPATVLAMLDDARKGASKAVLAWLTWAVAFVTRHDASDASVRDLVNLCERKATLPDARYDNDDRRAFGTLALALDACVENTVRDAYDRMVRVSEAVNGTETLDTPPPVEPSPEPAPVFPCPSVIATGIDVPHRPEYVVFEGVAPQTRGAAFRRARKECAVLDTAMLGAPGVTPEAFRAAYMSRIDTLLAAGDALCAIAMLAEFEVWQAVGEPWTRNSEEYHAAYTRARAVAKAKRAAARKAAREAARATRDAARKRDKLRKMIAELPEEARAALASMLAEGVE